jgi:hypothetical protein
MWLMGSQVMPEEFVTITAVWRCTIELMSDLQSSIAKHGAATSVSDCH